MKRRGILAAILCFASSLVGQNESSFMWLTLPKPWPKDHKPKPCPIGDICLSSETFDYKYALIVKFQERTVKLTASELMDILEGKHA